MMLDCTAPAVLDSFKGDATKCQLITSCQARYIQAGVPIHPDIKTACDKALTDWKASEAARAATVVKPQDDAIRALIKK